MQALRECPHASKPVGRRRTGNLHGAVHDIFENASLLCRFKLCQLCEYPDGSKLLDLGAQAIFEAVLPRNAGDAVPQTPAGILVAVADRLDSLVGLFAAGAAPSASADPFALRRSAYGMLEVWHAVTCILNPDLYIYDTLTVFMN